MIQRFRGAAPLKYLPPVPTQLHPPDHTLFLTPNHPLQLLPTGSHPAQLHAALHHPPAFLPPTFLCSFYCSSACRPTLPYSTPCFCHFFYHTSTSFSHPSHPLSSSTSLLIIFIPSLKSHRLTTNCYPSLFFTDTNALRKRVANGYCIALPLMILSL